MAELLLKVGDNSSYVDGDVLCAFNRRQIRRCHAEHLCQVRGLGHRPADSLARWLREHTHQYRFDRLSKYEVRRTNLLTEESEVFTHVKFRTQEGEKHIDVPLFVRRRLKHDQHSIFGSPGAEFWYGGRIDFSHTNLDKVWSKIEELTDRTEVEEQFSLWPMGRLDIRHHLAVRTQDFTDGEAECLVSPQFELNQDGEPVLDEEGGRIVLAKRDIRVDWKAELLDDLQVTENQVLNPNFPVGRVITIPGQGRVRHESKSQPTQSDRSRLQSKSLGGRLPNA